MEFTAQHISTLLAHCADPARAAVQQRFFKTGHGEYAEGDVFIGIPVPQLRAYANQYKRLGLQEISILLSSKIHEERALALFILTYQFSKADGHQQDEIYAFYMQHLPYINNWNLVDTSAPHIVGAYLFDKDKTILMNLAQSENLWHRRIAIIATQYFIRQNAHDWTIKISELLLADNHDLIHKAVGWMLREMGQQDINLLTQFLDRHQARMPRTCLRYSIEKFPQEQRILYLKKRTSQQKNT